jgi:hypothetical protein
MVNNGFDIPIVFFIYKRPDLTFRVFEVIRKIKPENLIIVADGPIDATEKRLTDLTRIIVSDIDWTCNVKRLYSDVNLGCTKRIITGLNEAFSIYEKLIIIEDDCLPSISFFRYCSELLDKYNDNYDIMHISGSNILGQQNLSEDYFFTNIAFPPWGWASWRRAWEKFNFSIDINDWETRKLNYKKSKQINFTKYPNFERIIKKVLETKQTWDIHWMLTILDNKGLVIYPTKNLISNIGFDERGVHTKKNSAFQNMQNATLHFPLKLTKKSIVSKNNIKKIVLNIESFAKELIK